MKVTKDKTENCQVFLTIEMEPPEVEAALQKAYSHLVKRTNVPGFRKGKAPRAILERYLGKKAMFNEALEHMLPEAYDYAVKEQGIEVFAQPQVDIAQTDPVVFKAIIPLKPAVELGDYHSIKVSKQPVETSEADVERVIERLRHNNATWEPVEREVGFGDLVVMDIESSVDGAPFINQKGAQYQVIEGASAPAPGFAGQLAGMKLDGEKEFKLKLPSDYARSELAEKEASFKVKIVEIKQERLPELNEEFARQVDPEVATLEALREKITTTLKARAEEVARMDYEEKAVGAVAEQAQVEFPPVLVEMEINRLLEEQLRRWQMSGQVEHYLSHIGKTEAELREELRPLATERVTRSLVLSKVTEAEKVEVSEAEIDAEVENLTKGETENQDRLREAFNTPQSRESIKNWLLTRNTVKRLVEIAGTSAGKET